MGNHFYTVLEDLPVDVDGFGKGTGVHNVINDFLGKPRSSEFVEEKRDCIMKFFNALARYSSVKPHEIRRVVKKPTSFDAHVFDPWLEELLRTLGAEEIKIMREQMYRYHGLHRMDVQKTRHCVEYISDRLLMMRRGNDKNWLRVEEYEKLIDQ